MAIIPLENKSGRTPRRAGKLTETNLVSLRPIARIIHLPKYVPSFFLLLCFWLGFECRRLFRSTNPLSGRENCALKLDMAHFAMSLFLLTN